MNLSNEIYEDLIDNSGNGRVAVRSLENGDYRAFTYRYGGRYGVMFEVPSQTVTIDETFSYLSLSRSSTVVNDDRNISTLELSCETPGYERPFSALAADFLNPDIRRKIIHDPYAWWKEWKELVGNVDREPQAYSVLGELMVTDFLTRTGQRPVWQGESSVVDIVADCGGCEVKSSIIRNTYSVEISSQFQLDNRTDDVDLFFCIFEPTESQNTGRSIEEMASILESEGLDQETIESKLSRLGMRVGKDARRKRYRLIEMRKYRVDDGFPAITSASFKNDQAPPCITHIRYTVELSALPYKPVDYL